MVAELAGETVAAANDREKGKTLKAIIADCLAGRNGRTKVEGWVPRWMRFPPSTYTDRGGVGTVAAHAEAEAAREIDAQTGGDDEPDPAAPQAAALPDPDAEPEAVPLAA